MFAALATAQMSVLKKLFHALPTAIGTVGVWNGDKETEDLLNNAMKTDRNNTMKSLPNSRPGLNKISILHNHDGGASYLQCPPYFYPWLWH